MRLALAYAPASARPGWQAVLALDSRLAGIIRSAREPMLAQLRLAWWRDRLSSDPAGWPKGEPLLADLAAWGSVVSALVPLVDGWEALLGEAPLGEQALQQFAAGRAGAMAALAGHLGVDPAQVEPLARRWALADLALHLGHAEERATAGLLLEFCAAGGKVPAAMRPLAVLAGLNERAIRIGATEALSGPGALLAALRLGIIGR